MDDTPEKLHLGWYKYGNLPHYDAANAYQMITFRLKDSLPSHVLSHMKNELFHLPAPQRKNEYRKRIEAWLDSGYGCCVLGKKPCARILLDTLIFYDEKLYTLIAWVIMPNHCHMVIRQTQGKPLGDTVRRVKSYSSKMIRNMCNNEDLPEAFWQSGYWDRMIRNQNHFRQAVDYVLYNPVKAGLVTRVQDWEWSGYKPCL